MSITYRDAVIGELSRSRLRDLSDNFDTAQRGPEPPAPSPLWRTSWDQARERMRKEGLRGAQPLAAALSYYLTPKAYFSRYAKAEIDRGELLYGLLADQPPRDLLVKLIAYRILGHRRVRLPRNTPEYWQGIESTNDLRTPDPPLPIRFMDLKLGVYDLSPLGYDIRCHASPPGLACTVVQKQYEYHRGDVHCRVEPGDVVIDAGACWGETMLYFADLVGPEGVVVSFDFIPSNVAVTYRNLGLNMHLLERVRMIEHPLWQTSGRKLYFVDWGPGSRVTDDVDKYRHIDGVAETVTINDTLQYLGLDRVDFIKMDIEGAELAALKGAEESIRRSRPKLAISLYHSPEDFHDIPAWIDGLGLGYRFYLDHHTIYENETVLFAVPPETPPA